MFQLFEKFWLVLFLFSLLAPAGAMRKNLSFVNVEESKTNFSVRQHVSISHRVDSEFWRSQACTNENIS